MNAIDTLPRSAVNATSPTLVHLSGDIDIATGPALRRRLMNTLAYSTGLLVLDLSQVTFCGAAGLGLLVGVQSRARARGITLALTRVPANVDRVLRLSGLAPHFPTTP
ncbi:STAS domain-containing protein [Bailinhaonella thermotolerans]|uniref:Anti-sigma factor antagonist n=1 Tax=Bailinhaonella thermotolerans TaxID=1070861 RepID=A0A3A4B2A2_9ACTN|nr:STAS domain-containing protein [Bailinhaonella thermotolerans]RJL35865.1 anti-sigma factor antagonist [Bailinhaonella thermotolerans]